jgi:Na+-transporting NADH:ubiquinone oxidoreductase subunit NqrC
MRLSSAELALLPIFRTLRKYQLQEQLLAAATRNEFSFPPTDIAGLVQIVIEKWMSQLSDQDVASITVNHDHETDLAVEALKKDLIARCLRQLPATRIVHITRRHRVLREKQNRLPKPRN